MSDQYRDFVSRYADIVIQTGVALYAGQKLHITTGYKNYEFACTLAEAAYRAGASYAGIEVVSNLLTKIRIRESREDDLSYVPEFSSQKYAQMCAEDWAFIRIDDTEELDILSDVPVTRLGMVEKAVRKSKHIYYKNLLGNRITWCVICAPGPGWALYVTGSSDVDGLLRLLGPILRLDHADPAGAWREHGRKLIERREKLNAMQIDSLHFVSETTDLRVYLNPVSEWHGGPSRTLDGRSFTANIPTEEVFTTPDYTKTQGTVQITRPLRVLESVVENVRFTFDKGRVVDFSADAGGDVLAQYFEIDTGAQYLGEVALVGGDSPLVQSGELFGSILYDENASSHIALGSGYPSCLSNMYELHGDDALKQAGCNVSLVHTDFMIGSDSMNVTAVCRDGKERPVMKNQRFVI